MGERQGIEERLARAADTVERSDTLERLSRPVHQLAQRVIPRGPVGDLLRGRWLGHPAHPVLIGVPIGCWTSASLMDALGHRRASQALVGAGVVGAVPTALSGLADWVDTAGAEQRTGFLHLSLNLFGSSVYAGSWWARRRQHHGAGVALALLGAAVATGAGWLGGHLAYALGVGVDTNAFDGGPTDWTPMTAPHGDGPLRVGQAEGVSLLVVADGERPRVLSNRCSHRGGPLAEGSLDGGCVTCPWHGSRFDLTTGAVRHGPAVAPQPVYEVRQGDDGLEVRRDEPRSLRVKAVRPRG